MKLNTKRMMVIIGSVIFLLLFLSGKDLLSFNRKTVSADVIDEIEWKQMITNKEELSVCPKLIYNGSDADYDKRSNTFYFPQNISVKHF